MKFSKPARLEKPTARKRKTTKPTHDWVPGKTLNPRLDIVFKLLFSRYPRCLKNLLSAVLRRPVSDVEILNPELPRETAVDKGPILDLRVRLQDGMHVHVEMQLQPHAGLRKRQLYYWARSHNAQIARGGKYRTLQPTVGIFFLDFNELQGERFHSIFRLLEIHSHQPLTDALELHILELRKLPKRPPDAETDPVLHWCQFLAAETDEEREHLAMIDPQMHEAKTALEQLSKDRMAQELAFDRQLEINSYHDELQFAKQLAMEEGKAEGRAEGKAEGRAEGKAEGRAEGKAEGRAEGKAEGRAEGKAEGRAEGEAKGRAEALVETIEQLCQACGIELTTGRRATLEAATLDELRRIINAVAVDRAWTG